MEVIPLNWRELCNGVFEDLVRRPSKDLTLVTIP